MDINVILPFAQAIITVVLLSLVLRHPRHNTQTRWFALFLAGMSIWGLSIGMMRFSDLVTALYWEKTAGFCPHEIYGRSTASGISH